MVLAIKQVIPRSNISFLAREYTRSILERATGVDQVFVVSDVISLLPLVRLIRRSSPSVVFLPSPRFSLALAALLARVPTRVGTGYRWYSFLFNRRVYDHRKDARHHEAEYNLRMLATLGIDADLSLIAKINLREEERVSTDLWLREHLVTRNAPFIVLHMFSGGSAHGWPPERFVELGRILKCHLNCEIILTGTESDRTGLQKAAQELVAEMSIGRTLPELAALLERALAVVTVSTGPGHLAAALGTPTVGLNALPKAISKERWGFRGDHVANISAPAIAGCPQCKECTCMERIEAPFVAEEVMKLIHSTNPER